MSSAVWIKPLQDLDDEAFEEWLCLYFKEVHGLSMVPQRNGRRGQAQSGVDLMFSNAAGEWVGVQAKAYTRTKLTPALLDDEIAAAHGFTPPLTHYFVCTFNDRDGKLQEQARGATIHKRPNVHILSVQDLAEEVFRRLPLQQDLINRLPAGFVDAIRSLQAASPVVVQDQSTAFQLEEPLLRAIGAWTDAGDPQRTLGELVTYRGPARREECVMVELRARFALGDLDSVVQTAMDEQQQPKPCATVLALGAQAAALKGDTRTSDAWLAQALAVASDAMKPQVVGSYLRTQALRRDRDFAVLKGFAVTVLGDLEPVALALADAAFQMDELSEALAWYERARVRQAHWPPGARGNELGARTWQRIRDHDAGVDVAQALRDCVAQFTQMLGDPTLRAADLRIPLLVNLGHARRVLGELPEAATAWDEALALSPALSELWLQRCALSAAAGVTLPSEALIERYTTSATARLMLASACTSTGLLERAERLIQSVLEDPSATSRDRVLGQIERFRLNVGDAHERADAAQMATMLGLVDLSDPFLPLFAWLVRNFDPASPDQGEAVHTAVATLAGRLPLTAAQRVAVTEDLLGAGLDDVAVTWLPDLEREVWPDQSLVRHRGGALALLHLYGSAFRFDSARRLIAQLGSQFPRDAQVAMHCAHGLHQAGDRLGSYHVLTAALHNGAQDASLIECWAQLAVILRRRREAHCLLRDLEIGPGTPGDYAKLVHARGVLGLQGGKGLKLTPAMRVTPENAGAVFKRGVLRRSRPPGRLAYGQVARLRIVQGEIERFNGQVLLLERPGEAPPGLQALDRVNCAWIDELIGARTGETRRLTQAPFVNHLATVVEIVSTEDWGVRQAAKLVHLLPTAATGVQSVPDEDGRLLDRVTEQAAAQHLAVSRVLTSAQQGGAAVALIAAAARLNPRGLLRKARSWCPTGHPGTAAEIAADDQAVMESERLVLDPVALLLMVDIGADSLLATLPARPVMTYQAAWQLFDWWYEFERRPRGVVGHIATTEDGLLLMVPVTAVQRRETLSFWRRVRKAVTEHVELVEPPPLVNEQLQRCRAVMGAPVVSGMAVAAARGWAYVAEEAMIRAAAHHIAGAKVSSLHRLLVVGSDKGWWRAELAVIHLATLIRNGWSWVSFPVSMLRTSLRLSEARRDDTFALLLARVKLAEPRSAVPTLLTLLSDLDTNTFPALNVDRLRKRVVNALPDGIPSAHRGGLCRWFAQRYTGRAHRASRRCLERWAGLNARP